MLIKPFALLLVALTSASNVLALPLISRPSEEVAGANNINDNSNNGQGAANAPAIVVPPPTSFPDPIAVAPSEPAPALAPPSSFPQGAIPNNDPSQKAKAATPPPATPVTTANTLVDDKSAATKPAPDAQAVIPAADTPIINNAQVTKIAPVAAENMPKESMTQQAFAPNTEASSGTNNDPVPQSPAESPVTTNNNAIPPPALLVSTKADPPTVNSSYQISDSPIVNGVQPQSSSDTEVSGANKAETKGTQPPAAPVAQTDSKPQDVPHAMVASTPPPSTAATEPQTAPKPEVTAVPPSSPQSVQELKAASEPEAVSDPISTEAITDKQETKGDALVTQEEPATPQPIPALVAEAKPEPQTVAPAAEAKPELQPAPAQEPKLEAAPVAQEKPTPEADPVLAQEAKHEAASTPQFKSDPKAAPELKEASEQSLTPTLLSTEDAADAKEPKTTAPVTQEEPTNPRPAPVAADPKPKPQPAAPVAEGKPKPEPFPAAVEEKPVPHSGPAQESNHEAFSTPPSTEDTTNAKEAKPATVAQDETQPEPAPAAVEVKPEPQPAPAPAQEKPKPQPAPVTHAPPEAEALLIPTTATECLTLLLKTQQSLTESCQKLIRTDANLIQAAELGLVGLDFMYSKGTPVISIDGFRLKFSQLPGHTLSVIESRHDVTIAYEGADVATFSPPWASATMDGSTLNSPIDHVDIKVLSDNAFSDFVATLITKPEANIVLRGVVDVNVSIASAAGGPPKTFIIAGLQFSSPIRLDGLNNLTQKKFVQSNGYQVYGEDFYFSSVISFANPSNLDITFGSVSFDAIDGAGKPLSNSAIDVFEITSDDNDVELRLISNVDDSMAFLNKLHSSGDTVTFQGTTASSTNKILAAALSQLKFTVTYPAVADIPPQTPLVAPMPGGV